MKAGLSIVSSVLMISALVACNNVPTAPDVAIEPESPMSSDDLALIIVNEASDPDGSVLFYRTAWFRDGMRIAEWDDQRTVPASETTQEEVWRVDVNAVDSELELGETASAEVTIQNAVPTLLVSITPDPASTHQDLTAVIESEDADGDAVTYSILWDVDGAEVAELADLLVVPAASTEAGETWTVTVTPDDGIQQGEAVSASVTIVVDSRPNGFTFCAGGGTVANSATKGVHCTAPLDLASATASNADLKWYAGPIQRIAP